MFKLICPHCNKENVFQSLKDIPNECSFCFEPITEDIKITKFDDNSTNISCLKIIYQKNGGQIEIPIIGKVILGRNSHGNNIFSKILNSNGKFVISRIHCSIEFIDGCFYLADEDSKNGTFYGINKINCKNSPQIIEDKSLLYIGEEPFFAKIIYKNTGLMPQEQEHKKVETFKTVKLYRCNEPGCGYESETFHPICPKCSTYNSLIALHD